MFGKSIYSEIREEVKKDSKRRKDNRLIRLILLFSSPFLVLLLAQKPYEYVSDLNDLPDPVQTPANGGITIKVNKETVHIDYLAEYDIQGRVLKIREYGEIFADNRVVNKIGPRDLVLGWSFMGDEQNMDKFVWSEFIDRMVQPHIKPEYRNRLEEKGGRDGIITKRSNNHPIWSNSRIRLLFKKIKVGDVIRLKGYLVNVYPEGGSWRRGPSSLVRDDHGCEIIYVTEITRLKER